MSTCNRRVSANVPLYAPLPRMTQTAPETRLPSLATRTESRDRAVKTLRA